MIEPARFSAHDLFGDAAGMEEAVRRAMREAVLAHARAGRAVPTLRDGKVVWLQPDEVFALFAEPPGPPRAEP